MIDLSAIPDEQLSQTLRLMKGHFIERGWHVEIPYIGSAHCFINRGDGATMHIFSATPPTSSYAASHLANDKYGTYQLLLNEGVSQLKTQLLYNASSLDETIEFMNSVKKVVVKPVDGGHGKGITVNVESEDQLRRAVTIAQAEEKSVAGVLVQEQYLHDTILDVRVLCIDYKFVAATWRVAARVSGDGVQTLGSLIESENASEKRGRPYYTQLAVIDIEKAKEYLGEKINDVPAPGEEVFVLGIANYGAGGETIDVTDQIPDWMKDMAEKAAAACRLPVIGVDFMLAAAPSAEATFEALDPMIIEVNKCPSFAIHDLPTSGVSRNVAGAYVAYLATL